MNYSIIGYILGWVLMFEGVFMIFPVIVGGIYSEREGLSYLLVSVICLLLGAIISRKKPAKQIYFAKEGFLIVALSWITMSVFGALPYMLTGEIPNVVNAIFESVSGFTTTGGTILDNIEGLSHTSLFWRSFTHWIGGMGVFVLLLAIMPLAGGQNMHLLRAETTGPSIGKLVPRIKDTAKILYIIYFVLTLMEIIIMIGLKAPLFDAITISFGTAGTGGFAIKNTSILQYSHPLQAVVAIFMVIFGVNFNAYYLLLTKRKAMVLKLDEVKWYLIIVVVATIVIAFDIFHFYDSFRLAVLEAGFHVASIITTTGYSSSALHIWPQLSKTILFILMLTGACAGSTAGGIKISRILILFKSIKKEINYFIHPKSVKSIRMDDRPIGQDVVNSVSVFLLTYSVIFIISILVLALDNLDLSTNIIAVAANLNNVGLGLELLDNNLNYNIFSTLSKFVLIFDMLAGRLELYPILILFSPSVWQGK